MVPPDHGPRAPYEPRILHREERFHVSLLQNQRPHVILNAAWHADVGVYMTRHELCDLSLNWMCGWNGGGVEFLKDAPPLRSLAILDSRTFDINPVRHHAETLEDLVVECPAKMAPRLADLPALRRLCINWAPGWERFSDHQLHRLGTLAVQNWPHADLSALAELRSLEVLALIRSRRLEDITALRGLPQLRELDLHHCQRLQDISVLAECASLQRIELACPGATSVEFAASLPQLRYLFLGKPDIPTIAPLAACTQLRRFGLEGRVLDGNLEPLMQLPHFEWAVMRNRRGYHPKVSEINSRHR